MNNKKIKVVVLGSMIYDCVVCAARLPKKGETIIGRKGGNFAGGKGANQAVQAARLGAEVYMISKVGDDAAGDILVANLTKNQINTDYVFVDPEHPTDTCCIQVANSGDNAIIISPEAGGNLTFEEVKKAEDVIRTADIFITQLELSVELAEYGLKMAKSHGVRTILNPAPAREIPDHISQYVDYVTPNETEAEFFTHVPIASDYKNWCRKNAESFEKLGFMNCVITLGKKGAYFSGQGTEIFVPTYQIEVKDTTAAGDAFNAAFAVKLAEGGGINEALQYACGAGSLAASKSGAQTSLSSREELDAFMQNAVELEVSE